MFLTSVHPYRPLIMVGTGGSRSGGEMDETIVSRLVGFSFLYLEEEKRAISSILTTSVPGVRGQPLSIIPGCHSEVSLLAQILILTVKSIAQRVVQFALPSMVLGGSTPQSDHTSCDFLCGWSF